MIRSEQSAGYLVEHGPNTLQSSTPLLETLIGRLDLAADCVAALPTAKKRFVVRDGAPRALPMAPADLLTSSILSLPGKLRLLKEPFVRARSGSRDESVADFVRRRLGPEVLQYGVNPFVGGIYAGDPERLSVRHTFERLVELEREHGSLLKGLIAGRRSADKTSSENPKRKMFSFREGLQQLPDALATVLGDAVEREKTVTALHKDGTAWHVETRAAEGSTETHVFDGVISTLPLHQLSSLNTDLALDVVPLTSVAYPPVSVVALGFRREDVAHPLDGFGMLVPEVESNFQILGTLFPSSIFTGRAPDGHVLLATFVGGTRHPELGNAETDALLPVVKRDLNRLLGVRGQPAFVQHIRWPRAIPQYTLGYGQVKARMDAIEAQHPRLALAGNYRDGVSVGDTMDSGDRAAQRLVEALQAKPQAV